MQISTTSDTARRTADVARTLAAVAAVCAASAAAAQPAGLIHWWKGEDSFLDAQGSAHGTNSGATFADGRVGRCFSFDGNDSISFGDVPSLDFGTADFSVAFWVRATAPVPPQGMQMLGKRADCVCGSFWDSRSNRNLDGGVGMEIYSNSSCADRNGITNVAFLDGTWHHYLFTRTASTVRIYRDGTNVQVIAHPSVANISNSASFRMGVGACQVSDDNTVPLIGQLDEVRIFSRALTPAEALCEAMRPDFNQDGSLDAFDYDDFVSAYFDYVNNGVGFPDYNGDGYVDAFDYDDFVSEFFDCTT